jgi:hypothetical protein
VLICGVCTGCPDNDPAPAGVIRQGVPYSDTGNALPLCPGCSYPFVGYRGGPVRFCQRCAVPDVQIPDPKKTWERRELLVVALARRGFDDERIGAESGLATSRPSKLNAVGTAPAVSGRWSRWKLDGFTEQGRRHG